MTKFLIISEDDVSLKHIQTLVGSDLKVVEVDDGDFVDPLPADIDSLLYYSLDNDGAFVVDFQKVFESMVYIVEKPMTVTQTFLRLHTALENYYREIHEKYTDAKEEFEQEEARLRTEIAAEDSSGIKKTAANIDAVIKTNPTWKLLKMQLTEIEKLKSRVYTAKEAAKRALDLCTDFVSNGKNVFVETVPDPHKSPLTGVIRDTLRFDE